MKQIAWNSLRGQMYKAWKQCRNEGLDVDAFLARCRNADAADGDITENERTALYDEMLRRPMRKDFTYTEPNGLEQILHECTVKRADEKTSPDANRVSGAWAGRIAGCMLGKPLEGQPYAYRKKVFGAADNWPVSGYLLKSQTPSRVFNSFAEYENCFFADAFDVMPDDDDTNYTVLSLLLLEKYGENFSSDDVAETWLAQLPYLCVCTAERVAYRNALEGFGAPLSAIRNNPYREYIGAQIRSDFYGYIYPGQPLRAVNAAFRDASFSHVKNGIYGAMFVAAALSIAAVDNEPESVVRGALDYIPKNCRLRKRAEKIIEMHGNGDDFEQLLKYIRNDLTETDEFDWVHVLPNALIVVSALLCGKGNFDTSITLAVSAGLDTDCNGATVGSVVGMMKGFDDISPKWYEPFHRTMRTNLSDVPLITTDELTERTLNVIKKLS